MPLGPVNESYSPYQSTSAFAGNFLLISLERLVDEGLLSEGDIKELEFVDYDINYDKAKQIKIPLLQKAYYNYYLKGELSEYNTFCENNSYWLEDYSLFTAIDEYIIENKNDSELYYYFNNLSILVNIVVEYLGICGRLSIIIQNQ